MIGDARHLPLKDESVHCVVTSPPYWGLRKYDIPDLVWDGIEGCEHQWGSEQSGRGITGGLGASEKMMAGSGLTPDTVKQKKLAQCHDGGIYSFCLLCDAWRGQLGLEPTIDLYIQHIVQVFREVKRVLRKDGTLWLNIGDSYMAHASGQVPQTKSHIGSGFAGPNRIRQDGLKPKDLCIMPARVALALQADGWWVRSDIVWHKPNPMPESVTDRPTRSHEYIFLLTKSAKYFFDQEAVREPVKPDPRDTRWGSTETTSRHDHVNDAEQGMMQKSKSGFIRMSNPAGRNIRSVWTISTKPYPEAHYATFPEALVERCIKAGTSAKGCCSKCGSPWVRVVENKSIIPKDYEGKWKQADPNASGRRMLANVRARRESGEEHDNPFPAPTTLGWQPTCACGETLTVPCVVLDPFCGSGTISRVADKLGRIPVGVDLGYSALQKKRLVNLQKEIFG